MQYRYVSLYQIRGLIHTPDQEDIEIYASEDGSAVRAVLTNNIDEYCCELYREAALGYIILKGFTGQRESDNLKIEIEMDINKIRERQHKEIADAEAFVFTASGETELDPSQPFKESEDFIVGFHIINKRGILDTNSKHINAALTALYLSTEQTIQIKCVKEGIYLINESGKPVFSIGISGSGDAYSAIRTTDEIVLKTKGHADALASEKSLARVNRLLVQAISRDNDNLRRFIFAWSALEIFINTLFTEYEKLFVKELRGNIPFKHEQRFFDRIRVVMKDKYRITDKFNIIAAFSTEESEPDIEILKSIKKKRDDLFHGKDIDEDSLPVNQTLNLLKKYLQSHIGRLNPQFPTAKSD